MKRFCPECHRELFYSNKYQYQYAETHHSLCRSCSKKGDRNWVRKNGGLKPETIEKLRKICGGKTHSNYRKNLSEETKQKISDAHKKENLTYEQIVNYRKGAVKRIERQMLLSGGKYITNYNPIACTFFDRLNRERGWNGKYATNGGEHVIHSLGYFLDYYEPVQNIVIEWDEPYHKKKKQQLKDELKEKEITELLGCRFYRIKQYEMDFDILQKLKSNGDYDIEDVLQI